MSSTLYVIATPIGNLEDITIRALRLFKEVDIIVCEDTRVTRKLLNHYGITKKTVAFNAHASDSQIEKIISFVEEGKNLALVTDAGTPAISDPGSFLVEKLRERFSDEELSIVSVPGPSALTAALSISGIPASEFLFLGFLPTKKGRQKTYSRIKGSDIPVVFYESTHRIIKCLEEITSLMPEKHVVVAKELTKMYERVFSGSPESVKKAISSEKELSKGEFVVIVSPPKRNLTV